jgi:predicted DNA-binding protein
MKSSPNRNFHVPLPDNTYSRLKSQAQRQHKPATQLVKQAVEYWLDEQERLALHEEIADYAAATAGTGDDLDESLEAAGIDILLDRDRPA